MQSFYSLQAIRNDGTIISMDKFSGKKLMIVNTASECGFTPQYAVLQEVYNHFGPAGFEILAFPSHDFGGQEPGNDEQIADFCAVNYGVTFPVMQKSKVLGEEANPVFRWLATSNALPEWNFAKFLLNEKGELIKQLPASESPASEQVLQWLSGNQL